MRRIRACMLMILALALAGCYAKGGFLGLGYYIDSSFDEFEQRTTHMMRNNVVPLESGIGGFPLDAGRIDDPELGTIYVLAATYSGDRWMFVRREESLLLMLDGEVLRLSTMTEPRRIVRRGGNVREVAVYPVPAELLRRIAGSAEVKVRLAGSRRSLEGVLSPENVERFAAFVAEYVDGAPERAVTAEAPSPGPAQR